MANRGIGDDGRGRIWGEGMDWTCRGLGYRSDQDDGNGVSEMFGHDRSPPQRTRSFPIFGNMTRVREDSMASISPSRIWHRRHQHDQSVQSNPRPDQYRSTEGPQDQRAENTLKLLHDVMTEALGNQGMRTQPPEVSKLLSTMKNIGSYKFKGGFVPIEAGKWITMMEKNFEAMECPEKYQKKIKVYYLESDATRWWDSIDRQRGHTITSWESFKGEFERKYFPPEAKHRLERQFMNLVQGDRPVRSYESEFTRLRRHVFDGREDEATMIRNFMYGLKPELGSRLSGSNFSSLSDLVEKAVNVETLLEAERKTIPHSGGHTKFSQGGRPNFNKGPRFNKGKGKKFGGQTNYRSNTGCHYASSCPNKPIHATPLAIRAPPSRPGIEPAPKKQNLGGRVYALGVENPDNAGPSSGPITGWWDSIDRQRGHTITSWESFKGEFERKYFPPEAKHRLERQFMNLVQGDRPVRSYESEFTRLRRHVFDGREDEATMIRNFMYGLKPELGSRLAGSNFSSLSELVEKAVNVETVLEAERKTIQHSGGHTKFSQGERPNFNKGPRSNKAKGRGFGGQANNRGNTRVCYTCDQPGHISRFCPKNQRNNQWSNQQGYSSLRMEDVTCFSCGRKVHYASSCPNKPIPSTPLAIRAPPSRPAIETAPKKQNLGGRVYASGVKNPDNAGPSSDPITGIGCLTSTVY
ncbi:hypothetical protein DY000_02005082 [Brassica cretica]|uniref:CCHC-type domain-containing protein n=1 Tax=Brassica cretica TaxID=69181 RepID=A0ABQ7C995_BRACR|nr:hypothetical protein DY000_02005082 [Brassica cretica]